MSGRVYVVKEKQEAHGPESLVRANTKGGALRHVAEKTMVATVATQDDLIRLVGAGVKVEDAGQEPEEQQGEAQPDAEEAPQPVKTRKPWPQDREG